MTQKQIIIDYLNSCENFSDCKETYNSFPNKGEINFQHFKATWLGMFVEGKTYTSIAPILKEKKVINLSHWTPRSENFSRELFETYKTGKGIDTLLSVEGGATKGSQIIMTGEPGVGKTTVQAYMQKCFQDNYPDKKIVCVQTEMKKFDIGYEYEKNGMDWMGDIQYIILKGDGEDGDVGYELCKEKLVAIFTAGYDIIFLDSIADMVEKLKSFAGMKESEAESFLLSLMDNASDGKNNHGIHTTTFAIQQITKGGEFKGDNKLKHMTTGMLHFMFDKQGNRYVTFSKNRRCGGHVNKKLYFSLDADKNVIFDIDQFNENEAIGAYTKEQASKLKEDSKNFFEVMSHRGLKEEQKINNLDDLLANAVLESNKVLKDLEFEELEEIEELELEEVEMN